MKPIQLRSALLILSALLLAGCAGIRPAVSPPDEQAPTEQPEQATPEQQPQSEEQQAEPTPSEAPAEADSEPTGPQPVDDIELPEQALPGGGPRVQPIEPAPPGPEPVTLAEGYRVQVATTRDRGQAERIVIDLKSKVDAEVHNRYEEGRYILLAGRFDDRGEAVELRDELRAKGYQAAYIVRAKVPATEGEAAQLDSSATPTAAPAKSETPAQEQAPAKPTVRLVDGYRVQVLSLSDKLKAEQTARGMLQQVGYVGYAEKGPDGLWKVRLGDFKSRDTAEQARARIVGKGYDGAYIVETKIIVREQASK